jgi:hypothetical protein
VGRSRFINGVMHKSGCVCPLHAVQQELRPVARPARAPPRPAPPPGAAVPVMPDRTAAATLQKTADYNAARDRAAADPRMSRYRELRAKGATRDEAMAQVDREFGTNDGG